MLKSTTASKASSIRFSQTAAYYSVFILLGLTASSLGPTLPGLADHTRSQLSQVSLLFSARSLGYLLGSLQGGSLIDRFPSHRVMAGMLLVMACGLTLAPVIPWLWLLMLALLFLGIGEGAVDVSTNVSLPWVHREKVGPFMNGLHFFFGLGAFFSPILAAQAILRSGDIGWAYWILALLALIPAVLLMYVPSPQRWSGRSIEADRPVPTRPWLVMMLAVFFFLYVGAEAGYGGWIYTYATRQLQAGNQASLTTVSALLTSAFWGALTVGRLAGIPISARFSPRAILFADLLGSLLASVLLLAWPKSPLALWTGTLAIGFAMASVFPAMLTFAGQHLAITGKVTRWFFVGTGAGGMFLPWLIGQLFDSHGPLWLMVAVLVDTVISLLLFAAVNLYIKND